MNTPSTSSASYFGPQTVDKLDGAGVEYRQLTKVIGSIKQTYQQFHDTVDRLYKTLNKANHSVNKSIPKLTLDSYKRVTNVLKRMRNQLSIYRTVVTNEYNQLIDYHLDASQVLDTMIQQENEYQLMKDLPPPFKSLTDNCSLMKKIIASGKKVLKYKKEINKYTERFHILARSMQNDILFYPSEHNRPRKPLNPININMFVGEIEQAIRDMSDDNAKTMVMNQSGSGAGGSRGRSSDNGNRISY